MLMICLSIHIWSLKIYFINCVNEDINRILNWTMKINLTINTKKTTAIILGIARYINNISYVGLPHIIVGDAQIPYSNSVKYLGLTIFGTFSWSLQVIGMISRVNTFLCQLKIYKQLISRSLRIRLISTLIFPIFDYCCTVMTDITYKLDLKLQRALNV